MGDRLRGADVRPIGLARAPVKVIRRNPAPAFGSNVAAGKGVPPKFRGHGHIQVPQYCLDSRLVSLCPRKF
jgi:hypothetical protein